MNLALRKFFFESHAGKPSKPDLMAPRRINLGGAGSVLWRELQQGSRKPFNYWLRVGSAAGGLYLFHAIAVAANGNNPDSDVGLRLFSSLHLLLLALIFCFVPAMTADCIAREKRDGTLSLLFLTPLTAAGIVMGKVAVQAFRTFTIWLTLLPLLVVPFLFGGVSETDVQAAVAIEFCIILICLASGMLATSITKSRSVALVLAWILGGIGVMLLTAGMTWAVSSAIASSSRNPISLGLVNPSVITGLSFDDFDVDPGFWLALKQSGLQKRWDSILAQSAITVLLFFMGIGWLASWCLQRSWRDKPPSRRQENPVSEVLHASVSAMVHPHEASRARPQSNNVAAKIFMEDGEFPVGLVSRGRNGGGRIFITL
jgi:ABC-type transport system involved in multi-copper enzyme maturation permease subunit